MESSWSEVCGNTLRDATAQLETFRCPVEVSGVGFGKTRLQTIFVSAVGSRCAALLVECITTVARSRGSVSAGTTIPVLEQNFLHELA